MGVPDVAHAVVKGINVILREKALPSVPRMSTSRLDSSALCRCHVHAMLAARDAGVKRFSTRPAPGLRRHADAAQDRDDGACAALALRRREAERGAPHARLFQGLRSRDAEPPLLQRVRPAPGPRQPVRCRHPDFVTAALKTTRPVVYGDGEQSRDFSYIDNIVNANLLAARAKKTHGEVVNIACGEAVTVNAIIGMINELLGKNVKPIYAPARPGDVKHSLADITAAKKLIGFEPVVLFREGLEKSIDWYRHNSRLSSLPRRWPLDRFLTPVPGTVDRLAAGFGAVLSISSVASGILFERQFEGPLVGVDDLAGVEDFGEEVEGEVVVEREP